MSERQNPPAFRTLISTFLRISLLGFGGPNAHLALMLDEVVEGKKWITREHFMHLVGATNLLPGPNSSEVAIHIGYTQRGWRGAFATGLAFLLPTLVLVTLFSALYFRFGTLPAVEGIFWGLKPVILAIILAAGWKLARTALGPGEGVEGRPSFLLLGLALGGVAVAYFLDAWEVPAMMVGGILAWRVYREKGDGGNAGGPGPQPTGSRKALSVLPFTALSQTVGPGAAVAISGAAGPGAVISSTLALAPPLLQLLLLTVGAGAVLFGGGYMLVALLEPLVVESLGWLTPQQFLDGIALTQAVPGPIVTLVAFVGYGVAGIPGAVVATAGIYLPSFAAVLLVAPRLERWRHVAGFKAALKGVNAVVAGAILGVGFTLLPPALPDLYAGALFLAALLALVRFKLPAVWVVVAGLAAGVAHILI